MSKKQAIIANKIFDIEQTHHNCALLFENDKIIGIVKKNDIPYNCKITKLDSGIVIPGFVDLQVNGGGGVLLNEDPSLEGIKKICAAHTQFGTTALLATLITDTPEMTRKAIAAAIKACSQKTPGFLGLHLEGPHLSVARKGAHDASLIRKMRDEDLQILLEAKQEIPFFMVTIAPESVTINQIKTLAKAGIIISLGHSNCTFEQARSAINAGAKAITHLFNAMSPLTHRNPAMVGAALNLDNIYCSLIADGFHVDPSVISIAHRAKKPSSKIFLISDAMSTIGTDLKSFTLNGRKILRKDGRLLLEDGTLAGADLEMASALRYMKNIIGIDFIEAIKMASLYPAKCINAYHEHGHLKSGAKANFIHLDEEMQVKQVWLNGEIKIT